MKFRLKTLLLLFIYLILVSYLIKNTARETFGQEDKKGGGAVKEKTEIDYKLTKCYKSRIITSTSNPKFKLDAFCINLKDKKQNMDFIHSEWDEYLNISRFIALSSCTKSHVELLKNIYKNKENIKFPIVIMEDDVYRKNNFTKYAAD